MDKRKKYFLISFVTVEIVLVFIGLIYVYFAGFCYPGEVCPKESDVLLDGFLLAIIFGLLAPIIFVIYALLQKKKKKS